ncbi:hypothetical protein [Rubritalea profundi]|uniref:Uncharacterized protein n=1 Tax=Rubritalea profundi TaxID=1658618 RepID=A0A2S7U084_9BACT|nr:hypothetical protein [Rubritalea profundi]PQJ27917.1 hypothetical protein BSZ32_04985 [Rubritalea profundi]
MNTDTENDKAISLPLVGKAGGTYTPKAMILGQSTIIMGDDTPSFKCIAISRETPILKKAYKKLISSVAAFDEHDCEEFLYVEFAHAATRRKRRLQAALNQPLSPEEKDARDAARIKAATKLAKSQAKAEADAKARKDAEFQASPAGIKLAEARRAANQVVQRRNARIASICKA